MDFFNSIFSNQSMFNHFSKSRDFRKTKYKKGDKKMGYPKKHRGRRKIGSKKRRARKRNKKK